MERVSQSRISRWIFVAHRMGKFPGIKETWDTRQRIWLVQPVAGAVVQRRYTARRTKFTGLGAPLNQQCEIWEGRLAYSHD